MVPTIIESLRNIDIVKVASIGTTTIGIDVKGLVYMWGAGGSAGGTNATGSNRLGLGFGLV
jgi:hypothetical protein